MAKHQGAIAQIKTLVENFPEFLEIPAGGKCDVGQVDGHDTLVEAAVELVIAVFILPGTQAAAAAHNGEAVAFF